MKLVELRHNISLSLVQFLRTFQYCSLYVSRICSPSNEQMVKQKAGKKTLHKISPLVFLPAFHLHHLISRAPWLISSIPLNILHATVDQSNVVTSHNCIHRNQQCQQSRELYHTPKKWDETM